MGETIVKLTRRPPVHKSVQDAIRQYIVDKGLRPGDPMVSEGELARRLGVSRNSVREAVRSLESVGVLESRHGSGLFIRDFSWDPLLDNLAYDLMPDISKLADLLEIRKVLELGMVAAAIERLVPEQLNELRALLVGMRQHAEQQEAFPEEDREFHRVLFGRLENTTLLKLLDIFWLAFRKASRGPGLLDDDPLATLESHVRIVDALSARDVDRSRQALEDHYQSITRRLHQELKPDGAASALAEGGDRRAPPQVEP